MAQAFEHEEYASQLADLRDRLKLGLSEKAPEGGTPTAELAGQIKALRASVTVEAAAERVVRKVVRAERPVTARIRERIVERPAAKLEPQAEETEPGTVKAPQPVAEIIPLPVKLVEEKPDDDTPPGNASGVVIPAMYQERGHSERVVKRRQADGRQMTLW